MSSFAQGIKKHKLSKQGTFTVARWCASTKTTHMPYAWCPARYNLESTMNINVTQYNYIIIIFTIKNIKKYHTNEINKLKLLCSWIHCMRLIESTSLSSSISGLIVFPCINLIVTVRLRPVCRCVFVLEVSYDLITGRSSVHSLQSVSLTCKDHA